MASPRACSPVVVNHHHQHPRPHHDNGTSAQRASTAVTSLGSRCSDPALRLRLQRAAAARTNPPRHRRQRLATHPPALRPALYSPVGLTQALPRLAQSRVRRPFLDRGCALPTHRTVSSVRQSAPDRQQHQTQRDHPGWGCLVPTLALARCPLSVAIGSLFVDVPNQSTTHPHLSSLPPSHTFL